MIPDMASRMRRGSDLTRIEARAAMAEILAGSTSTQENADFVLGLAEKGETDEELLGMLEGMDAASLRVDAPGAIDMCGTGGDGMSTFNVSTAASFVVAAAGGRVAKHGNYSSSGASGSADIFEGLGCDLEQSPGLIERAFKRHGICFIFAQKFHPAMRHLAEARRQIGKRTAFNILGPLSNPAGVEGQLVGVSSEEYLYRIPVILKKRGAKKVMAVRSADGMDEFSTSSANSVRVFDGEGMKSLVIKPEDVGLDASAPGDIQIGGKKEALEAFVRVLYGTAGPAMIETAALNAAGGLVVAGIADTVRDGVELALDAICGGQASKLLESFVKDEGDAAKLEAVPHG